MSTKIILEIEEGLTHDASVAAARQAVAILRRHGASVLSAMTADDEHGCRNIADADGVPFATADYIAPPYLAVVLEGGVVQSVVSDRPEELHAELMVIDYDSQGMDEQDLSQIPQSDGEMAQAWVYSPDLDKATIDLDGIIDPEPVD